jgi:CRP/FNR family transcriptional regulator, cyclic AMP receptor protein
LISANLFRRTGWTVPPAGAIFMAKKTVSIFVPPDLFKRMDGQMIARDYANNEAIFAQGDKANAMFYVQTGNVKLTVESKNGKKAVLAILRKGDFFGEGCLGKPSLRMFGATAIQVSTIARVPRMTIARIIRQEPAFANLLIAHLVIRIGRIEEDLVDQIFSPSEKRLARLLLFLAHFGPHNIPEPVHLKVSQETLAEMIGTTRSRVSYFMNRFRKMGFIDYNGSLRVHRSLHTFLQDGQ